jgi:uncharacterized protein
MDGPPHIHDRNRCYADKRGSAEIVLKNLEIVAEQLDYFQVNAVYGPDTVSFLPETVRFFIDLNVPVVHLNPNITSAWSPGIGQKVQDIYTQIADEYIRSFRDGREIALNLIDSKIILFLKGGYGAGDRCGMGDTEWAFAPSGNIYPCERFIGEDDNPALRLGNVHTGLDAVRRCLLFKQRERNNKECHACSFRRYCMNWCGCTNYYMTGHVGLPGPFLCASEKAAIRVAEYVLRTLSDLDNELFIDHFLHYLHEADHATASIH